MSAQRIVVGGLKTCRQSRPAGHCQAVTPICLAMMRGSKLGQHGPNAQRLLKLKGRFDPGNLLSAIPLPGR
jgi:hypothetical protein